MSETKHKDSGIEWIGKIPNDWDIDKLTTICKGLYDGDWVNTPDQNKDNKGIRYLATGNIGDGYYIEKEANFIPNEIAKQNGYCLVEKGSLIMSRLCTPFARTCILPDNYEKYIIAVDNMRMDVCEDSKKYLSYLTQCNHWHYHFETLARGAVLKRISKKDILNTKIPIPPLPEQIKIANYLDRVISNLDRQIEINEQLSCKYKELKKLEIYECVTKGLPESRASRGYKDSGIEWIGEIPEDWGIVKNAKIMHRIKDLIQEYNNETILSLSVIGMVDRYRYGLKGKTPRNYIGYQRIKKGDLVLCLFDTDITPCCTGIAQEDGITSPAYSRMYVDESIADRGYYYYWYTNIKNMDCLYKLAHNVRNSISASEFAKIKVPLPPIHEQQSIATYLDQKCTLYDSLSNLYQAKANKLKELKKSMIYEYVTGKKQV